MPEREEMTGYDALYVEEYRNGAWWRVVSPSGRWTFAAAVTEAERIARLGAPARLLAVREFPAFPVEA